ncbi:MAG: AmmeMemoRadiSam system radical SAM enzyme [Candidatus Latescibacteria bacterium]|jgi:pyruvate formate lyase activating enzyme|nr:AmmeMemoRadiSam system radical SAM enzyme [Candidatus Latescibacterota bacterium]
MSTSGSSASIEARLYEPLPDGSVRCNLCGHRCLIRADRRGICEVRHNRDGRLETSVFGQAISQNADPVEKKPLYHFYPSSLAYSIATPGCNLRCAWCQNWDISQMPREGRQVSGRKVAPEDILRGALDTGCRIIAYTYTEPTIFFEYTYEIARLAHDSGLANAYVTNGYMTEDMLEALHPYLDGANVDLKAFRDSTYRKHTGARLQPVLEALCAMGRLRVWVEVTTLIIPGVNDGSDELRDLVRFIVGELGVDTPWHISRFFPTYKMADGVPTPPETMRRAREIGLAEGLRYVYLGNFSDPDGQDTACPGCGRILIRRCGFGVSENRISGGGCPDCGSAIAGVGMAGS